MRYYSYFPGCSLEATAVAYGLSTQAITGALDMELIELEDWNCCGSTPYGSTNELESLCIAARNLALAEKTGLDLVTPCSSCYTTLNRANSQLREYPDLKGKVDECLATAGLEYKGTVKIRHLFEVIFNDTGLKTIESKVMNPLTGLRVAPYYGCQLVRPEPSFDNQQNPQSLDRLIASLGAEPVPFPLKDRCCGGSLIIPELDLALGLIHQLLESAGSNGAQCIVTVCPLCQTNLDAYQGMVNSKFGTSYNLPILFFTQLLGVALGIELQGLGLDKGVISAEKVLAPSVTMAEPAT
ncbi:MAG TPA: disulfide reductase [Dehalococcoidia bacterium]|nr:disulfide reductase [Dehalococcoidia bacterium]